jgi:hypothetical protein
MKPILIILSLLFLQLSVIAQTYDYELPVNIQIRNDKGETLESINTICLFRFKSPNKDYKYCDLYYINQPNAKMKYLSGFASVINFRNWEEINELPGNISKGYRNICGLVYNQPNMNYKNHITNKEQEILLVYHKDGLIDFLIIGYDNVNTIVVNIL